MNEEDLKNRKAQLETENDQLRAELAYLDSLMRKVGFADGLETVKATAHELSRIEEEYPEGEEAA